MAAVTGQAMVARLQTANPAAISKPPAEHHPPLTEAPYDVRRKNRVAQSAEPKAGEHQAKSGVAHPKIVLQERADESESSIEKEAFGANHCQHCTEPSWTSAR